MKRPLLTGLVLMGLMAARQPGSAQLLAKVEPTPRQQATESQLALKIVLLKFKTYYRVDILFFDQLVEGQFVSPERIDWSVSLETNLKAILQPLGLRSYKAKNQGFVIAKKPAAPEPAGDPQARLQPALAIEPATAGTLATAETSVKPATVMLVRGRVTDAETNEGIPGANIVVKGLTSGTATDKEGNFQISVPNSSVTLVVSFVGYLKQEITVGDRTQINVVLKPDHQMLAETVVTGFGDREKRNVGYATTSVDGDAIRRQAAVNPIAALQGLVPGLQVQPGIGGPQSTPRFLIRGSASLDPYRNQPLIVIDNIVMEQDVVLPNRGGRAGLW